MSFGQGIIRCPPFCRTNCATKHHPLLVALLNCIDTSEVDIMTNRMSDFEHVVKRYLSVRMYQI